MRTLYTGFLSALLAILLLTIEIEAAEENYIQGEFSDAWFTPTLLENNDTNCQSFLEDAQQKYLKSTNFESAYSKRQFSSAKLGAELGWQVLGDLFLNSINAYGKTYHLSYKTHHGCGGACEKYQSVISATSFPQPTNYSLLDELAKDTHPPSNNVLIAYQEQHAPYLFTIGKQNQFIDKLLVYKLAEDAKWQHACTIALAPNNDQKSAAENFLTASASLKDLNVTLGDLSRGAGSCGSMKTHWRWQTQLQNELGTVLYRPWALSQQTRPSENSHGNYVKTVENLQKWALTGISEFESFTAYQTQLAKTKRELASFYHLNFGWPKERALIMAEAALTSVISRAFGFYMYDPKFSQGEALLRSKILNRASLTDIMAIEFSPADIDSQTNSYIPASSESILNVAIKYPEALKYLLTKGVSANTANAFGKTPLMYAAQYNNLDAAKILLEHDASPVATTTKPSDNCFYTLATFNMTPLHYAVRYSSAELIELLLSNGAATFIKAENRRQFPVANETPLDWFYRYTNIDSAELNINIDPQKIAKLEQMLQPPSNDELAAKTNKYVIEAEQDYKNGKVQQAYRKLVLALEIQPSNQRALSDMSLIAFKAGALGESLLSSTTLIKQSKNNSLVANAWYNLGLVCEQHKASSKGSYAYFNGTYYCRNSLIHPFLQSYIHKQTSARKDKLLELFNNGTINSCRLKDNAQQSYQIHNSYSRPYSYLYVLHPSSVQIDTNHIYSELRQINNGKRLPPEKVHPNVDNVYKLDESFSLTVLTSTKLIQFPLQFNGLTCETGNSVIN